MRRSRGRVVEVESTEELDRRLAAGARSLTGWHLRSVDLTERGEQLARLRVAGALFLGCEFTEDDELAVRKRGGIVFPRGARRTGRHLPDRALHRRRALRLRVVRRGAGRPGLRLVAAPHRPRAGARAGPARPRHRRGPRGLDRGPQPRRRHGRARHRAGPARLHRGGAARPPARPGRDRRHRWWARRDGGRQPRRLAVRPRRRGGRRGGGPAGRGPVVPAVRGVLGPRGVRGPRAVARRRGLAGHPDLALRPRAAERVRLGDREVLPQRHPRGDPAPGVRRGDRVPARRRRHGAGDLPGRLRELLRGPVGGGADGAGRPRPLDRGRAGLAAARELARGRPMEDHVHLVDTVEEAAAVVAG